MREEAIVFWQTLQITPETTPKDVLDKYRRDFGKGDFEEVSKFKWDQLVYNPTKENFSDFLNPLKKTPTQSFGDRTAGFMEAFLFGKLPVQIQHEFSTASKTEASVEEMKLFIQIRFQYQQFIPQAAAHHQFKDMSRNTQKQPRK